MSVTYVLVLTALTALTGWGQGRGAVFPAQQRPPGDPAVIARGKTIYATACSACHGVDLRGGQLGGPNLLRSQLALNDKDGELIVPVIQAGRPDKGMPPLPLNADDAKAVAIFVHSVLAAAGRQGSPPPADVPPSTSSSAMPRLDRSTSRRNAARAIPRLEISKGVATRISDAKTLQNAWVSGGGGGRGGRGGRGGGSPITVAVTLPSGEKVEGLLVRYDDFVVTLMQADGIMRTIRRDGDRPKVEIRDPLQGHRTLLTELTDQNMHDVTAYLVTLK